MMTEKAKALYLLNGYEFHPISGHEGGRNLVYVCSLNGEKRYVLRISALGDRTEEDYLAETEFIRYLARNGAPVADVIPSVSGKLLECIEQDGNRVYISLFEYAKGMLLSDNGYRYREGAPLEEYFYNTGKALGKIHRLSKQFKPVHRRTSFPEKYTCEYIDRLIPESYAELKQAILRRLETYKTLSTDPEVMAWFILISATGIIMSTCKPAILQSLISITVSTAGICLIWLISGLTALAGTGKSQIRRSG